MYIELSICLEIEKIQYLNSKTVHWGENIPSYIPNMVKCSGRIYLYGGPQTIRGRFERSESENCRRADLARARAYRRWGGGREECKLSMGNLEFFSKCDRDVSNAMGYEVQFIGDHVNWNGAIFYLFFFNRNISFTLCIYIYILYMWRFSKAVISEILGITKNVFKLLSKQTHVMRIFLIFNEQYDENRYDDNCIILLFELICDFSLMGQFRLLIIKQTNRYWIKKYCFLCIILLVSINWVKIF